MPASRLKILKTHKLFIGGKFPRTESGRVAPAVSIEGKNLENFSLASRKDFREAMRIARKAQPGWAKASAFLRGQILYRSAEIAEQRRGELIDQLSQAGSGRAAQEVDTALDRLVYHAGWTDKYAQLFGSINPVASAHLNFTTPEPVGVVAIISPPEPALLGLVSLLAPAILSGNSVVLLASEKIPLPAISFAEILATSDLPAGVVNILTGHHAELVPHFATHLDLNAIVDASGHEATGVTARGGSAFNLKRYAKRALSTEAWFGSQAEDPYWILETVEFKTAWHPGGRG